MLRVFKDELQSTDQFVITLELVPGSKSAGRNVDTVKQIAADAFADGRVSAVSITDNPGGNPSLSPDALGHEIFSVGMDVIVHFTCRDSNRVGLESRSLQLARLGMKNILALTGDYTGVGFGGQGAPVFDLDSVNLQTLFTHLSQRLAASGDPDAFFTGCAVSPFKQTEAESFAQYAKLAKKAAAGAQFIITQLGYDAQKFSELTTIQKRMGITLPTLGSVYLLTPKAAQLMNRGRIPGAVVPDKLLHIIENEWQDKAHGRAMAIERAARLGAVLKGLGYRGIHIGGIHKSFAAAAKILDRMAVIEKAWESFLPDFDFRDHGGFYAFVQAADTKSGGLGRYGRSRPQLTWSDKFHYHMMEFTHGVLFNHDNMVAPVLRRISRWLAKAPADRIFLKLGEQPAKGLLLGCLACGDCVIQHVAFLCPESQCPKHTRNGACGGSQNGRCEVLPDHWCVWYRACRRWAAAGKINRMLSECVPQRLWELNNTSSWINFHLGKDHQGAGDHAACHCYQKSCQLADDLYKDDGASTPEVK